MGRYPCHTNHLQTYIFRYLSISLGELVGRLVSHTFRFPPCRCPVYTQIIKCPQILTFDRLSQSICEAAGWAISSPVSGNRFSDRAGQNYNFYPTYISHKTLCIHKFIQKDSASENCCCIINATTRLKIKMVQLHLEDSDAFNLTQSSF